MTDQFSKHASSLESPASGAFPITPDDIVPLSETTRAIYVGGNGDMTVVMQSGQEVTFTSLPSGMVLPIRASMVKATGTTTTGIVGLA